jgi:hypothetical protein
MGSDLRNAFLLCAADPKVIDQCAYRESFFIASDSASEQFGENAATE